MPDYRSVPLDAPTTDEPILVEINARAVPILISALERYKFRAFWTTDIDYQIGIQQLCRMQEALLSGVTGIIEAIEALHRTMDNWANGTAYTRTGAGTPESPYVYSALPAVPPAHPLPPTAARAQGLRALQHRENWALGASIPANSAYTGAPSLGSTLSLDQRILAVQGQTGGVFGIGAKRIQFLDLLAAARLNTTAEEGAVPDVIQEILGTIANGGSIADLAANLLNTLTGVTTDGGLAVLQIATSLISATQLGATLAGLTAVVEELRIHNRQLYGGSGQLGDAPPAAPPDGLWREGMYAPTQIPGAPETLAPRPLAQLLVNRDSFGDPLSAGDWLSSIAASSSRTAQSLWDPENSETALSTLRQIRDFNGQIRGLIGGEFALETVIDLLTQLRERLGDLDHTYEQTTVLGRLDAVRNQTLVVAQRLFDATGSRTAAELLVEIIARLTTGNTNATAAAAAAVTFHNAALALLECICEGVNGPAPGAFTPFDGEACGAGGFTERLTSPVLEFQPDPLGGADFAIVSEWTLAADAAGVSWQLVADGEGGQVPVIYAGDPSGPRQLCVQIHAQSGEDVPILGVNFTPYRLNGSGQGGRPILQSSGANPYTAGFYSETSVGDDMGYYVTAAVISGEVPAGGLIIRIGAGALG